MTEQEIIDAGIQYRISTSHPMCIGGSNFSDIEREMNRVPAFEAGAKWMREKYKALKEFEEWMHFCLDNGDDTNVGDVINKFEALNLHKL